MTNKWFIAKLGLLQTKMEEFGSKVRGQGQGLEDWYYDDNKFFIQIDDSYSQCCPDSRTEVIDALEFLENDVDTIVKNLEEKEKEEKRIKEEKEEEQQEKLKAHAKLVQEQRDIEEYKRLKDKFDNV